MSQNKGPKHNAHVILAQTQRNGDFTVARVILSHEHEEERTVPTGIGPRKLGVPVVETYHGVGATIKCFTDKEAPHLGELISLSRALKQLSQDMSRRAYDEIHARCAAQEDDLYHLRKLSDDTLDQLNSEIKEVKSERNTKRRRAEKARNKALAEFQSEVAQEMTEHDISYAEAADLIKMRRKSQKMGCSSD